MSSVAKRIGPIIFEVLFGDLYAQAVERREIYKGIHNDTDVFSREGIFNRGAISKFEDNWKGTLRDNRYVIEDDLENEVDSFLNLLKKRKLEILEIERRKKDCAKKGGNRAKNRVYYVSQKEITPLVLQSDSPEELHQLLERVYYEMENGGKDLETLQSNWGMDMAYFDDEKRPNVDVKEWIYDWEIDVDGTSEPWSKNLWESLQERYEVGDIDDFEYDLPKGVSPYHQLYLDELYRQHRICRELRERLHELQSDLDSRIRGPIISDIIGRN